MARQEFANVKNFQFLITVENQQILEVLECSQESTILEVCQRCAEGFS